MNKINRPYVPINCSFYDYLEEAATLGQIATIEYTNDNCSEKIESKIQDLVIKDNIEYLILENGRAIRLDFILSFNGMPLPKSC